MNPILIYVAVFAAGVYLGRSMSKSGPTLTQRIAAFIRGVRDEVEKPTVQEEKK